MYTSSICRLAGGVALLVAILSQAGLAQPSTAPASRPAKFCGLKCTADSIVFVCDASTLMYGNMRDLTGELRRAVERLEPSQSFNIIFFRDEAQALSQAALLPANPENKEKATAFVRKAGSYQGANPLPALKQALAQKPGMIVFLAAGDFENREAVVKFLRENNPAGRMVVNTLLFLGNADTAGEKALKDVAKDNGGEFSAVTATDLER